MAANQNPPRRITAALVDLNGTLIDADGAPCSGAVDALQRLRAAVSVLIVTNTSKQTIESILDSIRQLVPDVRREEASRARGGGQRLSGGWQQPQQRNMGLFQCQVEASRSFIPSIAQCARRYMPQVFSSLTATRKLLEDRCLRPFLLLHPDVLPDFEGLPTGGNPNCVVVGLAQEAFSWGNMNQAFRILQKGGECSVNAAVRAAGGA